MAALYGRKVRVTVSLPGDLGGASAVAAAAGGTPAVEVEDLRVAFKIKKTRKSKPNEAEITIYNLNDSQRAGMSEKESLVMLQAGYTQIFGPVFTGDARTIDHQHVGPDWITKITAGDGRRAMRYARVSESWAGAVRAGDIALRAARELGVGLGNLPAVVQALNARAAYDHGYVAHDQAAKELDRVLTPAGFEWSIQDGRIQVVDTSGVTGDVEVISPSTGLVGAPETASAEKHKGPPVLKVKCLLRWGFTPGGVIVLEDTPKAGRHQIVKLEHDADTHATNWYSELEVTAL